jgi:hypothetical protein
LFQLGEFRSQLLNLFFPVDELRFYFFLIGAFLIQL